MRPRNKICPTCETEIKRLRNVPEFEGARYCSSDCTITAWERSQLEAQKRELAAKLAAAQFGRGTEGDA